MKKEFLKVLEYVSNTFVFTSLIWLSYYPFHWVNEFGLFLRGSIFNISNPEDNFEIFLNNLSSLGIIFFLVVIILFFVYNDEEDKG